MYGKVGRIFVDVPVTGLLSSPLKIEISEVFVVVRPKRYEEFNREAIEKTFIESTQSTLDKLEEYYKSKLEIIKSESSVVNAIINRLIDNIQVDVQNICIRFEDDVSNPKMPYAIGITLQAFQLYT
jgi:vacuolar protein sorting-associated protein 13A/C